MKSLCEHIKIAIFGVSMVWVMLSFPQQGFLVYGQTRSSGSDSAVKASFRGRYQHYRAIGQRLDQDFYFWSVQERQAFLGAVVAQMEDRQNLSLFLNSSQGAMAGTAAGVSQSVGSARAETFPALNAEWLQNQNDSQFAPIVEFAPTQRQWIDLLKSSHLYGVYNYLVSSNPRVTIAEARRRLLMPCYLPAFVNLTQNPLISSAVSFEMVKTRYLVTDFQCQRFGDSRFGGALASVMPNLAGIQHPELLALDVLQRASLDFFLSPSLARAVANMNRAGYYGFQELLRLTGVPTYNQHLPVDSSAMQRMAEPCWIAGFENLTRILRLSRPQALAKLAEQNQMQFWCNTDNARRVHDNLELIGIDQSQRLQFLDFFGLENISDVHFAQAFRNLSRTQPSLFSELSFRLNILKDASNRLFCSHPQFEEVLRILTNTYRSLAPSGPTASQALVADYALLVALILHGSKDENAFLRTWRREFAQSDLWRQDKPGHGPSLLQRSFERPGVELFLSNGYQSAANIVAPRLSQGMGNSFTTNSMVRFFAYSIRYLSVLRNYLTQLAQSDFWETYSVFSSVLSTTNADLAFLFATRVRLADICRERSSAEYLNVARESMRISGTNEQREPNFNLQNPQWRALLIDVQTRHCH